MMMTCGRARRLLWPDTGPREATEEVVEARAHVAGCELCRRFFEDMRRLGERIRAGAPQPRAPVEVRDRLFKAIARARTGTSGSGAPTPWRRRVALGLVATVLLTGTWLGYVAIQRTSPPGSDTFASIVEDRLRAQTGRGIVASDSVEVARWLADRLPFAVQIPIFPEAQLEGARTLLVDRQLGAVIEYAINGQSLTYYVLPAHGGSHMARPREIRLISRSGYHLATWEDAGLTHTLIATLPEPKLLTLAQYCIHQMMAELGRKPQEGGELPLSRAGAHPRFASPA
jgi:anti-sigma factor RsiW